MRRLGRRHQQRPPSRGPLIGIAGALVLFSLALFALSPSQKHNSIAYVYQSAAQGEGQGATLYPGFRTQRAMGVLISGLSRRAKSARDCAAACERTENCDWFEFCAAGAGCTGRSVHGECWLMTGGEAAFQSSKAKDAGWVSGLMKPSAFQAAAAKAKEAAAKAAAVSVKDTSKGGDAVDGAGNKTSTTGAVEQAGTKAAIEQAGTKATIEQAGTKAAIEQAGTKAAVVQDNTTAAVAQGDTATGVEQEDDVLELPGNQSLPLVFFDIEILGKPAGRIEMELFMDTSPRHAENFRQLCTGEHEHDAHPGKYHYKGAYFYRIIEGFIDQAGIEGVNSVFGGYFADDPGGLALRHTKKGLLSSANHGAHTNSGHFSIMMGPAPHLDGHYTIFGQVVRGLGVVDAINALANGKPENTARREAGVVIAAAGQLRAGTVKPDLTLGLPAPPPPGDGAEAAEGKKAVAGDGAGTVAAAAAVAAEAQPPPPSQQGQGGGGAAPTATVMPEYADLRNNESLPLVYFDIAIKNVSVGRMEMVLFSDVAPRHAENFRRLCTGERGKVQGSSTDAQQSYHFKGATFYRIVENWINQGGIWTDSALGGQFADDAGGLALQHDHRGLLSAANTGPNTNDAHFSIMMGPSPHLNGHYTIFGQVVAGWEVNEAMNAVSKGLPDNTADATAGVVIADAGQLRKGSIVPDLRRDLPTNATGYNY